MEDKALERIKAKKLREMLKTGRATVADIDDATFEDAIRSGAVLVDFWAEWCAPCRSMHPVFARMAKEYAGVRFARINVDKSPATAARFGVQSIPTFILFRDGRPADKLLGAVGEPGIRMLMKKHGL